VKISKLLPFQEARKTTASAGHFWLFSNPR
jgi:hypothetical protein